MFKQLGCSIFVLSFSVTASERDLFDYSLEELLEMEVSIATKNAVPIKKAPASVTLITKNRIQALGVKTLSELFNYIPGFYSSMGYGEHNQSYLVTRGHAQKYASTVLFLWNGQRLNTDYTGGINYLMRHISLSDVQSIEIIRGPGSSLYGSNAVNGVINIKTKINKNEVTTRVGSNSFRSIQTKAFHQFENWRVGISAEIKRDNGESFSNIFDRFGVTDTTDDPLEAQSVRFEVESDDFTWRSWFNETEHDNYYLFRRINNGVNELALEQQIHQFAYQFIDTDSYKLKTEMQWQQADRNSLGALAPSISDAIADPFLFGVSLEYEKLQLSIESSAVINENNELSAGVEFSKSQLPKAALKSNLDLYGDGRFANRVLVFDQTEQRSVLDRTRYSRSVYLSLSSSFSESITLTSGLRYDGYSDVDGRLNPRLALVYAPEHNNHRFKVFYGEAYKPASLGDLYDEESGLTQGNEKLDHTVIKTSEFVYEYSLDNYHSSITYFQNELNDIIGFTAGDLVRLDNIGENKSNGAELSFIYQSNTKHRFSGNLTHIFSNDSKFILDSDLSPSETLSPKTYGSVSYTYKQQEDVLLTVSATYRDEIEVLNSNSGDFRVNLNFDWHNWNLAIKNLTDDQTGTPTVIPFGETNNLVVQELPSRGREFFISYTFSW